MLALLLACASPPEGAEKDPGSTDGETHDADGDGFATDAGDCDDNDSAVYPGATERCDNLDNDCNGTVDDDLVQSWYADADADGFGNAAQAVTACEPPDGAYIADDSDCDDTRSDVYPSAPELCDGLDNDCDGQTDEDDATTWYADADGDGVGDEATAISACAAPGEGWVTDSGDCDDTRSDAFPGNPETCDEIDNDCNGLVDDGVLLTWYEDRDADGHGNNAEIDEACRQPTGYVESGDDCDDNDPAVGPAAPEVCNGLDDDCDGLVDLADPDADPSTGSVYYADADGDGYGDASSTTTACDVPAGFTTDNTDCDDTAADVSPAGTELCNGVDDDCDGVIDPSSSADALTWYADTDSDGYGDASTTTTACDAPTGYVADNTDCDDGHYAISPGASEVCNWEDDDCDGLVDDDDPTLDLGTRSTWYADADSDGYGDPASTGPGCDAPSGYTADYADCDDTDAAINPAATDDCDGLDNDCDGTIDGGLSMSTWYEDNDGDSYGGAAVLDCAQPPGTVDNDWDCDDTSASVYPGSAATCPWSSCLDLLTDGIASTDGSYWIDFAGTATETECDMTTDGGGWTLIFDDNFDSGADSRWSTTSTSSCGGWGTILGGYGIISGGSMSIALSTYAIVHTQTWVEIEYIALDSWDGESAYVAVDGSTLWSQSQNNHSSSYSEVCGWNRGHSGSYDSLWMISATMAHAAGTLTLAGGSTLDQSADDESFGLDDTYVWIR